MHDEKNVEEDTIINKNDIRHLEQSLEATKHSVEKLDNRIRGNGDEEGLLSRISALETKVKGILLGATLISSAVIAQLVANLMS